MPVRAGHKPVSTLLRVGEQSGFAAYACVTFTPRAASLSRFGVR